MRVRMRSAAAGPAGVWPAGSEIEVAAALAEQLIRGGYAVAVEPEAAPLREQPGPPAGAPSPLVETATDPQAAARETATGPAQRKEKRA